MAFVLPDYKDGSIVNLMSSIQESFGLKSGYGNLKILPKKDLLKAKTVVLIVIDGLGYNYLKEYGKDSALSKHLLGRITSVCPSTTAAAITTFHTGVAPSQHAVTGWFMHLKELGTTVLPLRFLARHGGLSLTKTGYTAKELLYDKTIFDSLKNSHILSHKDIVNSDYGIGFNGKARIHHYSEFPQMFTRLEKIMKLKGRKFIYAYWYGFDKYCHEYGVKSKKTLAHFKEIDREFGKFLKRIEGTDSIILLTADHGQTDIDPRKNIVVADYPQLRECLNLVLTGESRFSYAYVKPSKARQFERFFKRKMKGKFIAVKSEEIIRKGYFGLYKISNRLLDRVGDYIIIAEPGYALKDAIIGHKPKLHLGQHGGLSADEMYVPLIAVRK